jgi:hypothetical protein
VGLQLTAISNQQSAISCQLKHRAKDATHPYALTFFFSTQHSALSTIDAPLGTLLLNAES